MFRTTVAAVSRRLACQPSRRAWLISPGNWRATVKKPIDDIRSSYACQYESESSAVNSSASSRGTPSGARRRGMIRTMG